MLQKDYLTIGILAHVDAGKTTLTENLLFLSGATKALGSVDKGSAITDALEIEQSRGISVKTATVSFRWNEKQIQVVDTPGHIDFASEVDKALSVLDVALLVVSAKEGVQAHTINLWENLQEREIPALIFINKTDREGADPQEVFMDLERDLKTSLFALNHVHLSHTGMPECIDFTDAKDHYTQPVMDKSFENLAECDEAFMENYLEGSLGESETILCKAEEQIRAKNLVPVYFGSAKYNLGVAGMMDALVRLYTPDHSSILVSSAKVFKVEFDPKWGRLAYVRVYGSALKTKDTINAQQLDKEIKINQLFTSGAGSLQQVKELQTGEIGLVSTSELIRVGEVLGTHRFAENYATLGHAVLSVQVEAEDEKNHQKLGEALEALNIEDPQLDFKWYREERAFYLNIQGPIQTEVLQESLSKRFGIQANFLAPKVVYKETPKTTAEGFVRYWMPKPCWAIMRFRIEPAGQGSGVVYASEVGVNDISQKYQNEVERTIPWALKQGIKGWEVTDIKITLLEGEEHNVHSRPGDFMLATPMGIMRALEAAGTELLEPMYRFEVRAHQDYLGPVSSDLNQMKAQIDPPQFQGEQFTLTGRVSVEQAMHYSIQFNATTSGRGRLKLTIDGYEKTTSDEHKVRPYRGVSPLDESRWILHMRGAFKAEERML